MSIQIVPHNTDEPNDWVALNDAYEVIDRDDDLSELHKRIKNKYLITRNWHRPIKIN